MTCLASIAMTNKSFAATLTLWGAGSLRGALSEVATNFTQEYGIPVKTEFASSGSLRTRLENGEKADVFASADLGNAITLNQKGISGEVETFASNSIYAIAVPGLSLTSENLLNKFLDPNIKLGIAQPVSDPLGDYAIEVFRKADQIRPGSFTQLDAKAIRLTGTLPPDRNSPGGSIVYYLEDINKSDIYLVYYTSALAALDISPNLQVVELPDSLKVKADYGLTVLKDANPDSQKLTDYILSPKGQQILTKYGFNPAKTTSVPEPHGVGGMALALGIAFAMHRKLAKKQQVRVR